MLDNAQGGRKYSFWHIKNEGNGLQWEDKQALLPWPPNSCQQFGYTRPIQFTIEYPAHVALFTNPGVSKSVTIHPPFAWRITIMDNGPWNMDFRPRTMGNWKKTTDIGQWTIDNTLASSMEHGTRHEVDGNIALTLQNEGNSFKWENKTNAILLYSPQLWPRCADTIHHQTSCSSSHCLQILA